MLQSTVFCVTEMHIRCTVCEEWSVTLRFFPDPKSKKKKLKEYLLTWAEVSVMAQHNTVHPTNEGKTNLRTRLVYNTSKSCTITPVQVNSHWQAVLSKMLQSCLKMGGFSEWADRKWMEMQGKKSCVLKILCTFTKTLVWPLNSLLAACGISKQCALKTAVCWFFLNTDLLEEKCRQI